MVALAVITPYFQRKAGILRRALTSLLAQKLPADTKVEVIVVDDGSPISARTEAEGLVFAPPFSLRIIEQSNSGVAAARNTALRAVTEDADYVALLDSDDIWKPEHLATALAAFDLGADFYFCDSQRVGFTYTAFGAPSEKNFMRFLIKHGRPAGEGLYEIDMQQLFDECLRDRAFDTSTTVYRTEVGRGLTFDTVLRQVGEDCLFFYQLMQKSRRIFCSDRVSMTMADGVNIASSKFGWDDPGHLSLHMGQILACYAYRDHLTLSPTNQSVNDGKIANLRAKFAFFSMRYFLKKRQGWTPEVRDMVRHDRAFPMWYPLYVLYVAVLFPLRLYDPLKNW